MLEACTGSAKWAPLRTQTATVEDVQEWVGYDEAVGIGIITGTPSGVVVADFDRANPPHLITATVATTRGTHLYLSSTTVVKAQTPRCGDVKAEGGYVVAPPSLGDGTTPYAWAPARSLREVGLMPYTLAAKTLSDCTTTAMSIGVNSTLHSYEILEQKGRSPPRPSRRTRRQVTSARGTPTQTSSEQSVTYSASHYR